MSRTNAEQLAEAVTAIETSINTIEGLVEHAYASADFSFVDQYRDNRGATLAESGAITVALVRRMQGKLDSLANVLYVREIESIRPIPVDWRGLAKSGQRVKAIAELIKHVGQHSFQVAEARDVVDAYLKHGF